MYSFVHSVIHFIHFCWKGVQVILGDICNPPPPSSGPEMFPLHTSSFSFLIQLQFYFIFYLVFFFSICSVIHSYILFGGSDYTGNHHSPAQKCFLFHTTISFIYFILTELFIYFINFLFVYLFIYLIYQPIYSFDLLFIHSLYISLWCCHVPNILPFFKVGEVPPPLPRPAVGPTRTSIPMPCTFRKNKPHDVESLKKS